MAATDGIDELLVPRPRGTPVGLLVGLVACLASCASPDPRPGPPAQQDPLPTQPEERFQAIAEAAGQVVQEGALTFATYEGCCDAGADCLGNNPATPYGTYALPPSPGEVVAGDDIFAPWGEVPDGLHRDHRLREDEAIVLIGRTPPEVKYFGLRSYLNTRVDPSTGETEQVFASLGASLNQLVVAADRGTSVDTIFDGAFIVVTTADRAVEERVTGWLAEAGYDLANVHYDRMTHELARFGVEQGADTFSVQWRMAVPTSEPALEAYQRDPGATVLRITPRAAPAATEPHPWPVLPEGGSGEDEDHLLGALLRLQGAIYLHHRDHEASPMDPDLANVESLTCIPNCGIADIHDRFTAKGPFFTLDSEEFVVVYGPNHERTGKASYSSFAFMNEANSYGFLDVASDEMVGSAAFYLPNHPDADDLYAYTVARSCSGHPEPCVEVPTTCPYPGLDTQMKLTIRAYLEPATGAAPIAAELMPDRMTHFRPRPK